MGGTGRGAGCSPGDAGEGPHALGEDALVFGEEGQAPRPFALPSRRPCGSLLIPSSPPSPHESGATPIPRASVSPSRTHQHRGAAGGAGCRPRSPGTPPSAGLCCGWLSYAPGPASSRGSPATRRRLCPLPPSAAPGRGGRGCQGRFGDGQKKDGQKVLHKKKMPRKAPRRNETQKRGYEKPPREKRAKNAVKNITMQKIRWKKTQCRAKHPPKLSGTIKPLEKAL